MPDEDLPADAETRDGTPDEPALPPLSGRSDDAAIVQRARQRYGTAGAIVAGGMLGIDKVLGRPAKEEIPISWEASGEPHDIDRDGIALPVDDDVSVVSTPPPVRRQPRPPARRKRR